jgi:hypothetical protein
MTRGAAMRLFAGAAMISLLVLSCKGGSMSEQAISLDPLKSVPQRAWQKLGQSTIYFGHQSVGYNIIAGMERIMQEHPAAKLAIVRIRDASELKGPMFAHASLGENSDPRSKMKAFAASIGNGIGERADIAFFKLCYVDITAYSDVEAVFAEYKATMERLKQECPRTRFIHATVPLSTTKTTVRSLVKSVLGKEDNNINRNRFNDLLRKEYTGKGPVYDLAAAESTRPDGTRSTFTKGGARYYSLAPEYSDDGGHLNSLGQLAAARELLLLLGRMEGE